MGLTTRGSGLVRVFIWMVGDLRRFSVERSLVICYPVNCILSVPLDAIGGLIEVWSFSPFNFRSKELLLLLSRFKFARESFKIVSRFLLLSCNSKAELDFNTPFFDSSFVSIDVANETLRGVEVLRLSEEWWLLRAEEIARLYSETSSLSLEERLGLCSIYLLLLRRLFSASESIMVRRGSGMVLTKVWVFERG